MPAMTVDQVLSTFMTAIAPVFERWEDEHEYEADQFAVYFQNNVGATLGATVNKVSGSKRIMKIDVTFPDCRRVLTAWRKGATLTLESKRGKI